MHAPRLYRAKFSGECGMHGARASDARHPAECLADHEDAEMGLADTALRTHMPGVVRAVVCHAQHLGRERGV